MGDRTRESLESYGVQSYGAVILTMMVSGVTRWMGRKATMQSEKASLWRMEFRDIQYGKVHGIWSSEGESEVHMMGLTVQLAVEWYISTSHFVYL